MFPKTIYFNFEKDPIFDEMWRLLISLNSKDEYRLVKKWNKKPPTAEVIAIKELVMRSIQIYHSAFQIPEFDLKIESE